MTLKMLTVTNHQKNDINTCSLKETLDRLSLKMLTLNKHEKKCKNADIKITLTKKDIKTC